MPVRRRTLKVRIETSDLWIGSDRVERVLEPTPAFRALRVVGIPIATGIVLGASGKVLGAGSEGQKALAILGALAGLLGQRVMFGTRYSMPSVGLVTSSVGSKGFRVTLRETKTFRVDFKKNNKTDFAIVSSGTGEGEGDGDCLFSTEHREGYKVQVSDKVLVGSWAPVLVRATLKVSFDARLSGDLQTVVALAATARFLQSQLRVADVVEGAHYLGLAVISTATVLKLWRTTEKVAATKKTQENLEKSSKEH